MSEPRKPSELWKAIDFSNHCLDTGSSFYLSVSLGGPWSFWSVDRDEIELVANTCDTLDEAKVAAEDALLELHRELAKTVDLITQKREVK